MNKEEFSLDIDMSKADMSKLKDLLTSKLGLRHFAFQLKTGEYLDLVEYKDYEKLEKELEQLKEIEKEHRTINGELRVENKELKKQLEEYKYSHSCSFVDTCKNVTIANYNQQKEFINFLEDNWEKTQDIWYIKILQKYKEIIGVLDDKTN